MKIKRILSAFLASLVMLTVILWGIPVNATGEPAKTLTENFDSITPLTRNCWFIQNNSNPLGT